MRILAVRAGLDGPTAQGVWTFETAPAVHGGGPVCEPAATPFIIIQGR